MDRIRSTGSMPAARIRSRTRWRSLSVAAAPAAGTGSAFACGDPSCIDLLHAGCERHDVFLVQRRRRLAPDLACGVARTHDDGAVARLVAIEHAAEPRIAAEHREIDVVQARHVQEQAERLAVLSEVRDAGVERFAGRADLDRTPGDLETARS